MTLFIKTTSQKQRLCEAEERAMKQSQSVKFKNLKVFKSELYKAYLDSLKITLSYLRVMTRLGGDFIYQPY